MAPRTDFPKNGHALPANLIADIYEAAIDDERWPAIAQIVASAVCMTGTAVWIVDQGQVLDISVTEDLLVTQQPYVGHYAKLDPWQRGLLSGAWGQVRLGSETFSDRELLKTEFYNDFARPNGILRPMGAMMKLSRGTFATVAANRPTDKRIFEKTDTPRLERLLPHLRRALQLRLTQRKHSPRAQMHTAALDALAFGVVVCAASGRIAVINQTAEAMAKAGSGITLGGRRNGLGALLAAESRALASLIYDAASGGAGGVMRLHGRSGGAEIIALVTPLPRRLARDASLSSTYALVTLRSAWGFSSFSAEMLMELFSLSRTQAAIALSIFDGKSPDEIAAQRGVTISTLRTHLAEIFARTGAENQRDLVRLLGMLPPVRRVEP